MGEIHKGSGRDDLLFLSAALKIMHQLMLEWCVLYLGAALPFP